jgi:hydroxymethylpyrimidine/phosphomethylpyrimidine kinase
LEADAPFVAQQIDLIFEDIPPDAVKIGMVSNEEIIRTIAERLRFHQARNIVVDPVMISTSGSRLLGDGAEQALRSELMPIATIITPNIQEAEVLSRISIENKEDMLLAAKKMATAIPGAILIKGGHLKDSADDLAYIDEKPCWFSSPRVDNPNAHGTGCTLSSAIACNLAEGYSIEQSVGCAKEYVTGALKAGLNLGKGSGPLNHLYRLRF